MSQEMFTLTSGKQITVEIAENGEPESVGWIGDSKLSENEVYEIHDWLEDYDTDDDEEDDSENEDDKNEEEAGELEAGELS